MRPLTEEETKQLFTKLSKYIGPNIKHLIDRPDNEYCFRLHRDRVYYAPITLFKAAGHIKREALLSVGICFAKFTHSKKLHLLTTCIEAISPFALYKVWLKPGAEQKFLYGNHITRTNIARLSPDISCGSGIIVFTTNGLPIGLATSVKSASSRADPTIIFCVHHCDVGEYLRDEDTSLL